MKIAAAAATAAFVTMSASAGVSWSTEFDASFNGFGAEMPFGDGNMNENYTIARNTDAFGGIEVGLKGKERGIGQLPNVDGRYFAQAGSPNNDGRASWNIDFGYVLPTTVAAGGYGIVLNVDFDPGFGSQSWVSLDISQSLTNFFVDGVTSADGGSQNLDFGFWGNSTSGPGMLELDASGHIVFNADALGEYDANIQVLDASGGLLARADIVVEVVPAPGAAALLGLGGLVATRRRR